MNSGKRKFINLDNSISKVGEERVSTFNYKSILAKIILQDDQRNFKTRIELD